MGTLHQVSPDSRLFEDAYAEELAENELPPARDAAGRVRSADGPEPHPRDEL